MSQAQYDIYRSKVFALVRSLVIKHSASANAINTGLEEADHSVNLADPANWKYYLNLNGQYHATDSNMQVISLDTRQMIDFKKEVLTEHRTTLSEYQVGSRYFKALVERYPDQEILIRGILNPVDIPTAIAAKDGEILYYQQSLVEENETNLIPQLSAWAVNFMARWDVPAYTLVDDLYASVQFANLIMLMPTQVMNLRTRNAKTLYAHSFHIREYLASNGKLDQYVDFMTKKQMLWLYRNIRYLLRNAGKRANFDVLVQHILTDRALPLAEWSMRHNVADQIEQIYPEVELVRKTLNFGYSNAGSDVRTVVQMLDKEVDMARGNIKVQPQAEDAIRVTMENSLQNTLPTKILESSVLDLTDAAPYTLADTLINHWMYLAHLNRYNAVVTVDNPKSGGTITLTMQEAFITFLYAFNRSNGITLETIPAMVAMMVRKLPTPTRAQVAQIVDPKYVRGEVIDALMSGMRPLGSYISIPTFAEACVQIHAEKLRQRLVYSNQEHYMARGQAEAAMQFMYCDYPLDLEKGANYLQWFTDKGLEIPEFSELESELLAVQLYTICTGQNLKVTQSLKEMQAAMLSIMSQLSSYSIQFLQSINSTPIAIVDWPLIRPGDQAITMRHTETVQAIDATIQKVDTKIRDLEMVDLNVVGPEYTGNSRLLSSDFIDIGLTEEQHGASKHLIRVVMNMVDVSRVLTDFPVLPDDITVLSTYDYVPPGFGPLSGAFRYVAGPEYSLDDADRTLIASRWASYDALKGPWRYPLADVYPINRLGTLLPFIRE